jgi:hypothetical protein
MLKLRNSFKGHTVFTSQITAVCDGNSKIVNVTLVIINQPVHNKLTPSDIDKKNPTPESGVGHNSRTKMFTFPNTGGMAFSNHTLSTSPLGR